MIKNIIKIYEFWRMAFVGFVYVIIPVGAVYFFIWAHTMNHIKTTLILVVMIISLAIMGWCGSKLIEKIKGGADEV